MALTVTDLSTLDPAQVETFRVNETALVAAYNPNVDLKRGPTQDLVLTIKAALDTATQTNIDLIRQSNSLLAINENPALADTDTVNRLLSNYGLTRNPGAKASGQVTIVLSALVPTIIPAGTVFTINGQTFQPNMTYAGRTSSNSVVNPGDVLIQPFGTGYGFTISVTATTVGAAGNVSAGSVATLSVNPTNFTTAYAAADFTGGQDAETNADLLARQQSGLGAKVWGNRATIDAQLKAQFPGISATSVVGFGDPEMLRDTHSIWPGHTGGRSDVYVRTSPVWVGVTLVKTATLISVSGTLGTWQFTIARDDAPGYYQVDRILLPNVAPNNPGFTPSSDVRGYDLSVDATHTYFPDIVSPLEAAYGRYQTATVQFVDTVTNAGALAVGATASYTVICRTMPLIGAIQDFLGLRVNRPPMGDVYVKAAVPCFTTISLTLNVQSGTVVPVAAVAAALASAVNGLGFAGTIAGSLISQVAHNTVGAGLVSVSNLLMTGVIRGPDGSTTSISSSVSLTFTNNPAIMTTTQTVAFLLNPANVAITVVNVSVPTV